MYPWPDTFLGIYNLFRTTATCQRMIFCIFNFIQLFVSDSKHFNFQVQTVRIVGEHRFFFDNKDGRENIDHRSFWTSATTSANSSR